MHSALWSIAQQLIRQGFVAAFMFVLARQVNPFEFGLIGIANIWNNFLTLFLELGFGAVLVQRKEINAGQIASACALNFLAGAGMMLASMGASWPASFLMKAPEAQPVIFTLSLCFLITAVAAPQIALAQREFRFKELAMRDFVSQMIAAAVGIALALNGFGVWAVVANSLLLNLIFAGLVWRMSSHRVEWRRVSLETMRDLWGFGSKVFAYTGLKYLFRSADSILMGMLFGPEKLGFYNFSQRVTAAPTKAIQFGLGSYLFPKAATVQESAEELKELFVNGYKALNYLILTFAALLVTCGTELIALVFGEQWRAGAELIRILIFIQLLAPAIVPMAELLKAANRPNWLLWWSVLVTALTAAALVVGSMISFRAAAMGLVAAWWAIAPVTFWIVRKITGLQMAEFWRRVRLSYFVPLGAAAILLPAAKFWNGGLAVLVGFSAAVMLLEGAVILAVDADVRLIGSKILRLGKMKQ